MLRSALELFLLHYKCCNKAATFWCKLVIIICNYFKVFVGPVYLFNFIYFYIQIFYVWKLCYFRVRILQI